MVWTKKATNRETAAPWDTVDRKSLPRVVNLKIIQQPHQKYNITHYEEFGFSYLTQMTDDYTTVCYQLALPHVYISLLRLGECTFWTQEWKGYFATTWWFFFWPEQLLRTFTLCFTKLSSPMLHLSHSERTSGSIPETVLATVPRDTGWVWWRV